MEYTQTRIEALRPAHVAIIMDGNGRWARSRGLPRSEGHRHGTEALRRAVTGAVELGFDYLTVFAFSTENWKRPAGEVDSLMGLLRRYLQSEIAEFHKNGVCLRVIGERGQLPGDVVSLIEDAESLTASNKGLKLIVALNYSGRREFVVAARRLAKAAAVGELDPDRIDEDQVAEV
ncbi:MAG: di-trans,poly-cis-decaprenylcistransferase, partial [Xanthomonadales bacterium]|nr:di-trans,poly-cis-decaprenylcistransferase [Xanthomonadales bacterium]NIS41902.1 di-trans,poly-cis-decaprenylcistransferase [Desulfuromonadales bacterium]NIX11687.1 di-trans,poly-cis-decaprenylcistransferase [Xanthomonadales bacterium]